MLFIILASSLSDEDKYILSMLNILPSTEKQRMEEIQSQLMSVSESGRVQTASRFIGRPEATSTPRPRKFLDSKSSIKKGDIFNNRDNTCSRIELQIIDDKSMREATLVYDVLPGKTCLNYPVYKSEHMFIFHNVFGEWCQKEITDFNESLGKSLFWFRAIDSGSISLSSCTFSF